MKRNTHTIRLDVSRGRGFTLLEVMFAIMILGVGLIAVAAIFPVSGTMQKATFDEVVGQQMTDSIQAMLNERGLVKESDLVGVAGGTVQPVPAALIDETYEPATYEIEWPLAMRCFPGKLDVDNDLVPNEANPKPKDEDPTFVNRDYYWVPLVRYDATAAEWEVYVFVMKKLGTTIPTVTAGDIATAGLQLGEMIVHQADGEVGVVTKINPLEVNQQPASGTWYYGTHVGNQATTIRLLILGDEVIR